MSIRYSTIDQISIGPQLEVKDGGLILTYNTTGLDENRNARADLALKEGKHYWEVIVYGNETMTDSTANVGIVSSGYANNVAVGKDNDSAGYFLGAGDLWANGAKEDTAANAPLRSVVGLLLNLDDMEFTIRLNGLDLYTFTISDVGGWHPAFSISGAVAYGFSMFVNLGSRDFEKPVPEGYRAGVFSTTQEFSTILLATEDWLSSHTAEKPNRAYRGDIIEADNFSIDRSVTFHTMVDNRTSQQSSGVKISSLTVANDGRYDHMITRPPRDVRVNLKLVDRFDPEADPVIIGVALIDDVEQKGLNSIEIKLKDIDALLELPVSRKYFLPYTADGSSNRMVPISLGVVRNMEPQLTDPVIRSYTMHDGPLTQIGTIRDKGDKLDPLATPPDWVITNNQQGVELQTKPEGKLTADVSSAGTNLIVGSPDIDVVDPFGEMTTEDGGTGLPEMWFDYPQQVKTVADFEVGHLHLETVGIIPANFYCQWDIRFKDLQVEQGDWCVIKKGCYYRLTYTILSSYIPSVQGFGQFSAGWYVKGANKKVDVASGANSTLAPGIYTIDFRAECDGTLAYYGAGNFDPANAGGSSGPWWVNIDNVKCILKSALVTDILAGVGNFTSGLIYWIAGDVVGGSATSDFLIDNEYPSPGMGYMHLDVSSGSGNHVERYSDYGTMETGKNYRVAFSLRGSDANCKVEVFALDSVTSDYFLFGTFLGAQLDCECSGQVGSDCYILFRASSVDDLKTDALVSQVRVFDITDQLAESGTTIPLQGITLTDYVENIIQTRAQLTAAMWSRTDTEAIDAATGYIFGVHAKTSITRGAMLRAPLPSFTTAAVTDHNGTMRFVRLIDPALVDEGDIVLEVDQNNSPEAPKIKTDKAAGLTLTWGARRNWELYAASDFVDDIDPITGIDLATRTRFQRLSQHLVRSAKPLDSVYQHAIDAGEFDSLLDLEAHAQLENDRVGEFYIVPRSIYTITVFYDGLPNPEVRPGRVLRYKRKDLRIVGAGKKLYMLRVELFPLIRAYVITAWG